ncbi:Protein of unknown function DUF1628 [Methanohalobium evestigatum Z-7303]|uniref:Archaeal Type IV pilin N-terminal domain-containing protein n=1 Tax=Methanohalobium evestigatum (strain ATCC BAA-1072 / DSM 3721 / NBRC 107634 / OCM 161 / Z-7303) TaxID=644295 RepID=D7E9J4_METEZ|nr:type IV pilin N-terminal domain-containing protein [Methanohalobium evestigatum]ADI74266.1 Protein of unknown function DUF1628 [Methanohalobium evestigatum Z-7303]
MKMQKNLKPLFENSDAVTEVVGEILMTAIVVLAFSVLSVFAFSYLDITEKPHVDVDGWVNVESDVINLRHSGGEVVDTKDMKIIISLNNSTRKEIASDGIGSIYNKNTWRLGDVISIKTSSKWNEDIKQNDYVESTIVHTKSNIVIENGVLLGEDISEGFAGEPIEPPEDSKEDAYYVEYVDGTVEVNKTGEGEGNSPIDLIFEFNVTKENTELKIQDNGIKVEGQGNYSDISITGKGNKKINGDSSPEKVKHSGNTHVVKVKIKESDIKDTTFVYDDTVPDVDNYIIIKLIFDDNSSKVFYFKEE